MVSARRRAIARLLVSLVIVSALPAAAGGAPPSTAERLAETERRTDETDRRIGQLEAETGAARAELERVDAELELVSQQLSDSVEVQRAADRAARDARIDAERASGEVVAAERQLDHAEEELEALARRAYVQGRASLEPLSVTMAALEGGAPGELADRLHYLRRVVDLQANAVETAESLGMRLATLREIAMIEEAASDAALEAATAAADEVATSHARILRIADEADARYSETKAQLVAATAERQRLDDEEERLREAIEVEERLRRQRERQAAAAAPSVSTGRASVELATVRGITVARSIAPATEALLIAAEDDGIVLGGSGYRSPEVTARLRLANGCPDVDESPASSCRIPTARPGSSQHELGLAIDFTWQGQTICYPNRRSRCTGNAAFDWLRANASRFGFSNLPSEAWHWSTTGR